MEEKNPKHIAIILDGNRRYGKKAGNRFKGHQVGAKKVEELFDWCIELGIKEVTLYTFSTENFNRPKKEVDYLMRLFKEQFNRLKKDKRVNEGKIKINFIGRLELFSDNLRQDMKELMEKTSGNTDFIVNFAVGYGGRAEIVDSIKKIIQKFKNARTTSGNNSEGKEIKIGDIDEKLVSENLYLQSEPDIMIRPGGEKRMSNFLLWECAYSELFFLDKLWPEFEKEDLVKVIEEFKARERRFGE